MDLWYVVAGALTERRGRKHTWKNPHPKSVVARVRRRNAKKQAEANYVNAQVRRMELRDEAKKIYAQRHPSGPQVVSGAAPESRYSDPEFWNNHQRRGPSAISRWWNAVERP